MMLAIIGGDRSDSRRTSISTTDLEQLGKPALPIGVHSRVTSPRRTRSEDEPLAGLQESCATGSGPTRLGPISRAEFDQEADRGSLYCGSPETVARRIVATAKR